MSSATTNPDEAGSPATTARASEALPYLGNLADGNDIDWIALDLEPYARYSIFSYDGRSGQVANGAQRMDFDLLDARGSIIGESHYVRIGVQLARVTAAPATTYFVRPEIEFQDHAGNYEIRVRATGEYTFDDAANLLYGTALDNLVFAHGGDDTIYGGAGEDTIYGYGGNDLLGGGADDDRLYGNDGNDTLYGAAGNDRFYGGDGDDLMGGFIGDDSFSGGAGDDAIWGADGNDALAGDGGNDTLGGAAGDDTMLGLDGDDELWGAAGSDTLDGGNGDDRVGAGTGDDTAMGGAGDDAVYGGLGNDLVLGGDGQDTLYGAAGDDTLDGGAGDDALFAGHGADVILFSTGNDTVSYFSAVEDVLDLSGATAIADYSDLVANHLSEVAGSAVVADGLGNTTTLDGVAMANLTMANFDFQA